MAILKFMDLIRSQGLDPDLVAAFVMQESSGNPNATRYEPRFYARYIAPMKLKDQDEATGRATSWGLMQLMGQVAREHGFTGEFKSLLEPSLGLKWGCGKLSECLKRYPRDLDSAIAAYNAGTARKNKEGEFVNQGYVDSVKKYLLEFRKDVGNV